MSALTDWLFEKTPDETDDAPPLPPHLGGPPPNPKIDDDFIEPPAESYELEEVFTVIDYADAGGNRSRRRITMRRVARGKHAPILTAICHERRAVRHFRCDRIEGFIDDDGVVVDCGDFFRATMMIDLSYLAPRAVRTSLLEARKIRDRLRSPLSVLVALGRSDDQFRPEELDEICRFVEGEVETISDPTHPGDVDVMTELRPIIQRMRPSRSAIDGYLTEVFARAEIDPDFRARFEGALEDVLLADGIIAEGEVVFLRNHDFAVETR